MTVSDTPESIQDDYLAESAAILARTYESLERRAADAPSDGMSQKIIHEERMEIAKGYERLGALQRGLAPTGYQPSTRPTRELAAGFGRIRNDGPADC